jgi:hypothetical protein
MSSSTGSGPATLAGMVIAFSLLPDYGQAAFAHFTGSG